ncbi:MAG: hypothetical protein KGY78_01455 [Anaerolineae bacterium]|nr:hypothetical protein [Anaerolineae bacterium]
MARAWSVLLVLLVVVCAACGGGAMPPTAAPGDPTPTRTADAGPPPTPAPDTLYVDAGRRVGAISPFVYGTNYGPWSVLPFDLQSQAWEAGITYLRFPGGNWGDQHNLRPFHIDPFIELCQHMGAEPSISVRLEGGTPEAAAEVVRYVNLEQGYGVRYWSIGNEPSLYDGYDVDRYNAEWRLFAEAMLAVDPSILLIGPDLHQYSADLATDPKDSAGNDWLRGFLTANGDLVDVVSIHRYPFPTSLADAATTIDDLRANSREWDKIIAHLRTVVGEASGRDLPVAVTEINTHWSSAVSGEATPDAFYAAIWWGDVLGRLIRQRVEIVAHFTFYSKNSIGGWGLLGQSGVRPAYYVYQIYRRFGDQLVYASSGDPDLSIYAAVNDAGALTLIVINLGPREKTCPLRLEGFAPGEVQRWLFDIDHAAERIGTETLEERIVLPGQSMTLYVLEP